MQVHSEHTFTHLQTHTNTSQYIHTHTHEHYVVYFLTTITTKRDPQPEGLIGKYKTIHFLIYRVIHMITEYI